MRVLLVAAIVLVAALAGCSGKSGDDEVHFQCLNGGPELHQEDFPEIPGNFTEQQVEDFLKAKCPKASGSGSKTNTTSAAPNVLPVLKLNITDFGGNVTNVTLKNGNLTFDATGSFDPDGTLSAIAISVKDSNQTRTLPLYNAATKTFTPATFKFDRPGPVNVSIAMVDDRAGFNTTLTKVYVNEVQLLNGGTKNVPSTGAPPTLNDPCLGASGELDAQGPLVDNAYFQSVQFTVYPGASFVEAIPGEDSLVTICDPTGVAISDPAKSPDPVTSNAPLVAPTGTDSYKIGFYAGTAGATVTATVIVHYEPQAAAPAA